MIPGLGRSAGGGNSSPLQYSCLGNPWTEEPGRLLSMESQRLDMTERFHFHFRNGAWLLWHPLVSSWIPLVAAVPHSCPLRLSLHSQPQSSPWGCLLNPKFQHHPQPLPADVCLKLGSAGRWHRPLGQSPSILPAAHQLLWSPLSPWGPFLSQLVSLQVRGLHSVQEPFFFCSLLPGMQVPSHFLFFPFHPTQLRGELSRGFLPVISWHSVRTIPCVDVLLVYLCWGWAPHPCTPPLWLQTPFFCISESSIRNIKFLYNQKTSWLVGTKEIVA